MTIRPRIGFLGIMQELYDDMLPGITDHQAAYAGQVKTQVADVVDLIFPGPARNRHDIDAYVALFERDDLDGLLVVNLTYGPALNATRALAGTRLPIMVANIQPERSVTDRWDMADMTYNQGIHGMQDTANALVKAGKPFFVFTDDWRSAEFKAALADWAHAAAAVSGWKRLKIMQVGYPMNGMGDIQVDWTAMQRKLGPEINTIAPGELWRAMQAVNPAAIETILQEQDRRFEVDPRLEADVRADAARMEAALRALLVEGGYGAYSTHFGAIGEDGRFGRLPLAAASTLLAEGYGYGAEGDMCSAALVAAGHTLAGQANFTEMYAMDFDRDTALMSHMGEGNWKFARSDRKVRLIHRELGIGRLGPPPTFLFQFQPGPMTLASLIPLGGEAFRLVVAEGEIIDTPPMPHLEMPYGEFKPNSGVRECLNGWLRNGGTHHQCMTFGHTARRWRLFAELLGMDYAEV